MYITREDLAAAIGMRELAQLTCDYVYGLPEAELPDWETADRAIAYACELADGYLAGRYALPLENPPSLLRPICTDIARWWLHLRRINAAEFPKPLQTAYEEAVKRLEQIRDGKIHLGIRPLEAAEASGGAEKLPNEGGAYKVRTKSKQDWSGY